MLIVFVKYGRPVEEDAFLLLRNKLEDVYRQKQAAALDPKTRGEKRQRAIDELVDHQI